MGSFRFNRQFLANAAENLQAQITLSFSLIYFIAWTLYIPFYWFGLHNKEAAILCIVGGCLTSGIGAYQIWRHQRIHAGGMWANLGGCLTLLVIAAVTGGAYSPIQGWIFFGSVTTFLCHGRKSGFLIVGTSWVGILIIDVLDLSGMIRSTFPFPITDDQYKFFIMLANTTTIPALGIVTMLFDSLIRKAFLEANIARQAAQDQHHEMTVLFESLSSGVFSIQRDGSIGPHYSAFLKKILGEDRLEGKPALDTVFKNAVLSADARDHLKNTLQAILGEDLLSFELNRGNLPESILIQRGTEPQYINIDWNPVIAGNGSIEKILIAFQDVTEKRQLKDQASKANEEIDVIRELVESDHALFLVAHGHGMKLIENNRTLIESNRIPEVEVLKIMLMNIHTIKGECRSLKLSHLVNKAHEIEHQYVRIKERAEPNWNKPSLIQDLNDLSAIYQKYYTVARDKLGRHADNQHIRLERLRLIAHFDKLHAAETKRSATEVERETRDILAYLRQSIFVSLDALLQESIPAIYRLARDLEKETPDLVCDTTEIYLRDTGASVLRSALVHILRNIMDHGIEPREERLAAHKKPQGTIRFGAALSDGDLVLTIEDDGRGLDMAKVKSKGLGRGLCDADDSLETVAQLIFSNGLSTAASLTEISGRGVGMGAVKRFIEESGGKVILRIHREAFDGRFLPFALVLQLPSYHLTVAGSVPYVHHDHAS